MKMKYTIDPRTNFRRLNKTTSTWSDRNFRYTQTKSNGQVVTHRKLKYPKSRMLWRCLTCKEDFITNNKGKEFVEIFGAYCQQCFSNRAGVPIISGDNIVLPKIKEVD